MENSWTLFPPNNYKLQVSTFRVVNEATLSALAVRMISGVIVDIGESGVYVTPIFQQLPIREASEFQPCGGQAMTNFMDYMLTSRATEQYNNIVSRSIVLICTPIII